MLLGSMLGALSGVDGADGYGLFIASRVVVSPLTLDHEQPMHKVTGGEREELPLKCSAMNSSLSCSTLTTPRLPDRLGSCFLPYDLSYHASR